MNAPITEKRPKGRDWDEEPLPLPPAYGSMATSRWRSGSVLVISSLQMADLPDRSGVGPQWHVSISASGKRPKEHHVRRALRAFDLVGAEEDNHHPGVTRQFWRPVDPAHRVDCECKADEEVIVEPDGFVWTTPKDGPCSGCEYERFTGKPCGLHVGGVL